MAARPTPPGARGTPVQATAPELPPAPGQSAFLLPLLFGICALVFATISWQVVTDGPLRRADERLGLTVGHVGIPNRAAEFLADLGGMTLALPVLAAALAYAAWRARREEEPRWWAAPLTAALAMLAVPLLVVPLKALFDRQGPPGMGGHGGFYPSGHSATATVAYGAAVLLLAPYVRSAYLRRELLIGGALLVAAVGAGLVRRGYHWPLDVVASWALGGMLLIGAVTGARYLRRSTEE